MAIKEKGPGNRPGRNTHTDQYSKTDPLSAWIRATKPSRTDRKPKRSWGRGRR